jgi:DNA-directed RNA polymerase specialized sigma24 family protein
MEEDDWEALLEAEGMPPEPRRKMQRGLQRHFGIDRPWMGPYESATGLTHLAREPGRPSYEMEALMAAPHEPLDPSYEELSDLREILADAIDELSGMEKVVMERHVLGQDSLSHLGRDLGYSRNTIWIWKRKALASLRETLRDNPLVQQYLDRHEQYDE